MKYELLKSTSKDRPKLIEYKKRTIFEHSGELSKNEIEKINNYVINKIPKEIDNYFNIIIKGKVIGCLLLTNKDDGKLLDELYLEENYRNKGIGSDIIRNIIKQNDIVYLWVYKLNVKAVSLYEKLGFNIINETETRYYMKYSK